MYWDYFKDLIGESGAVINWKYWYSTLHTFPAKYSWEKCLFTLIISIVRWKIGPYFICPFVLMLRQAQHKYKRTKKSSRWLFFNALHSWNTTVSAISTSCFTVPLFQFALLYQNNRRQEKKIFFKKKACIREWLYWTKTWVPWGSSVEITETVKS